MEAILLVEENKMYLLFHSESYDSSGDNYETVITKYLLNEKERKIFEQLLSDTKPIQEDKSIVLTENQIRGAEYC